MAVDSDTKKALDEVKKGKTRRFVMICKGVKILSLVVYKKGSLEKYKKEAKQEGKGQFYHGIVEGKGVNVTFKLAAADGYDKPPGKELMLKDFLTSEAGVKFKPTYEIVAELPQVDLEDESSTDAPESAQPDSAIDVAGMQARFSELSVGIKAFVATFADRRLEVLKPAKLIQDFLNAPDSSGTDAIEDAFQALQNLIEQVPETPAVQPQPPQAEENSVAAAEFNDQLKALLPRIKEHAASELGDTAKLKASEAGVLARKKEFAKALELLAEIRELLDTVGDAPSSPAAEIDEQAIEAASPGDLLAVWRMAKDDVDQQLTKASAALRNTGHEYLLKIADNGLNQVADGPNRVAVRLQASLFDYNGSHNDQKQKAAEKLLGAIRDYENFVDSSVAIEIFDTSRVCGPTTLRNTLKTALVKMRKSVQSVAGN